MKNDKIYIAILIVTMIITMFPREAASAQIVYNSNLSRIVACTLLPPMCMAEDIYSVETNGTDPEAENSNAEITPEEVFSNDENVEVKIKFKFFEWIKELFCKIFSIDTPAEAKEG